MASTPARVNVVLDEERALKLRRLAKRTHTSPGTPRPIAPFHGAGRGRPDPRNVTSLLDRIDGALADARAGLTEADAGLGIPIRDL